MVEAPPGAWLDIDGRFVEGFEIRDLPAGTHDLHLYAADGRLLATMPVMLAEGERVVRGGAALLEVSRGPVPDRAAAVPADPTTLPFEVRVAVADRGTTRVQIDGQPVPYDLATGTHAVVLPAGDHHLRITVGGRTRHLQDLPIAGAPWRCGVDRLGATACVALEPEAPLAPPMDVEAARRHVRSLPPAERLAAVEALQGSLGCAGVASLMEDFVGDAEKLAVARALRPHVTDPDNHALVEDAVDFAPSREALRALYGTRGP